MVKVRFIHQTDGHIPKALSSMASSFSYWSPSFSSNNLLDVGEDVFGNEACLDRVLRNRIFDITFVDFNRRVWFREKKSVVAGRDESKKIGFSLKTHEFRIFPFSFCSRESRVVHEKYINVAIDDPPLSLFAQALTFFRPARTRTGHEERDGPDEPYGNQFLNWIRGWKRRRQGCTQGFDGNLLKAGWRNPGEKFAVFYELTLLPGHIR